MGAFAVSRARGGWAVAAVAAGAGGVALGRHTPARTARARVAEFATAAIPTVRLPSAPPPTPPSRASRCDTAVPPSDPHPSRPAELVASDWIVVARLPVLGPDGVGGREAIVRSLDGGWCVLVPAGPPITFTVASGWIWFAREREAPREPVELQRVPLDGGPTEALGDLGRLPGALYASEGVLYGDWGGGLRTDLLAVDDILVADQPATVPALPPVPVHPNRPPEVIRSERLARVAVGDYRIDEMVVRTTARGWCVVVPEGPGLEMTVARGWLYFVRRDSNADTAPVWLSRVPVAGGPIERLERVPSMPRELSYRNGDLFGSDSEPGEDWVVGWFDDEPPAGPGPCE